MTENNTAVDRMTAHLVQTEPTFTDTGFTAAVMTQLPRSDELPAWQRNAIMLAATALASAIVAWQAPITALPDLLAAAAADWSTLLGAAIAVTYGTAIAAVWTARKY